MTVKRSLRAGLMSVASAVIVSGLAYGVMTGGGAAASPRVEAAAVTTAPAVTKTSTTSTTAKAAVMALTTTSTSTTSTKATTSRPAVKATIATTLTLKTITPKVTKAQFYRAIFHGYLLNTKANDSLANQRVTLLRRTAGGTTWVQMVTGTSTVKDGAVFFAVVQTMPKADYKLVFGGKAPLVASTSPIVTVTRS
jgi:hypothetical protein